MLKLTEQELEEKGNEVAQRILGQWQIVEFDLGNPDSLQTPAIMQFIKMLCSYVILCETEVKNE